MALLVPNIGEEKILEYALNKASPEDLMIRLYVNNITPSESDTAVTYTEASGFGYTSIQLTPADWTISMGNPTTATHSQVTWVFTGALGNLYGYYITKKISGDLMWAERFTNGPYNIQNNGDELRVTPRFSAE